MDRLLMNDLISWKDRPNRKPLLLQGARQTGKTWLVEEFGRHNFDDVVKIDLMMSSEYKSLFDGDLDPARIISQIELRVGRSIDPQRTLLFFDEIQEAPRGITALKYFCERARSYHVIATGSYMGVSVGRSGDSFPVGKIDELTLRPMCFEEYLRAVAGEPIANAMAAADMDTLAGVSDLLAEHLKRYLVIGGMPEVVASFSNSEDFEEARRLQRAILMSYEADFSKHAPTRILERMRLVWNSLPSQLAKENRRFVYGAVREGGRARDFEESLQWLSDHGVTRKIRRVDALRVPLSSYEDLGSFKLFSLDVGLLASQTGLDARAVLEGNELYTEFKGALTEQYVCEELVMSGFDPVYWSAGSGKAETDFSVELNGSVVPIEVKSGENLKSKSLRVACDKFGLSRAVRTSLSGFRDEGWLVNIPLWAIGCLRKLA